MATKTVERLLEDVGAVMAGHFLLTSGRHSPIYLEKFRFLEYPEHTAHLSSSIARHFKDAGIQVVAGPTTGGVIVAYEVARQLEARSIYAERGEGESRVFRRGFTIDANEPVLVVDDIVTTGGSLRAMLDAVTAIGGRVAGVGVIIDRAEEPVPLDVPYFACYELRLPTYAASQCPQCRDGMPLTAPGRGTA
jgi:orotate phosphoribosyltransferase